MDGPTTNNLEICGEASNQTGGLSSDWGQYSAIAMRTIINTAKARGISMRKVESAVGISQGYISRAKAKGYEPSFEMVVRLCKYLNLSLDSVISPDLKDLLDEVEAHERVLEECRKKIDKILSTNNKGKKKEG